MSRYALDVRGYNAGVPEYTIQGFWECECDENYIHRTDAEPTCPTCGCSHDECPDAFLENVMRLPDLTDQERLDIAEVVQQARLEYYRKGQDHKPVATLWPYQSKLGHQDEPMGKLIQLIELNLTQEELTNVLEIARITLADPFTRADVGEQADLDDGELLSLLHNLTEIMRA